MVIALTLFPVVIVFMIGQALSSQFTPQQINKITIGLHDETPSSELKSVLQSVALQEMAEVQTFDSLEDGRWAVDKGAIDALVIQTSSKVQVISSSGKSLIYPIIASEMNTKSMDLVLEQMGKTSSSPVTPPHLTLSDTVIETEGKVPDGIDYYAVTTLLQCLFFGAMIGVLSVIRDISNRTSERFIGTPLRHFEYVAGKWLGNALTLFTFGLFILLFTKYVYGANWNGNIPMILLAILLYVIIAVSFGGWIALLTRNTGVSAIIVMFGATFFSLCSGGFARHVGPALEKASLFSPNRYAQDIIFQSIYGGQTSSTAKAFIVLSFIAIVMLSLSFIMGRRSWKW